MKSHCAIRSRMSEVDAGGSRAPRIRIGRYLRQIDRTCDLQSRTSAGGHHPLSKMLRWRPFATAPIAFLLSLSGCSSLQVPLTPPSFPSQDMASAGSEGVEVHVHAIRSDNEYFELFDDYLPQIGIAAIWVEVENTRPSAITTTPAAWELRIESHVRHPLTIDKVLKRYYARRRIRMVGVNADLEARKNLEQMTFPGGQISGTSRRSGFVFFPIDDKLDPDWAGASARFSCEFVLNTRAKVRLEVALSHAGT